MFRTQRFKVNSPEVLNDTIEGESVIINLQNGFYYSLDNIGSVVWNGLINHYSVEVIVNSFIARSSKDKERIMQGVNELITELIKENLIVALTDEESKNIGHTKALDMEKIALSDCSFTKPALNKFGDMQDLLLLDPIHEVDEAGWPLSKPEDEQEE